MAIHYIRNFLAPSTPGIERWPDISSASIASAPAAPYSHLSNYSDTVRSRHYEQPLSVTAFTGVPRPYSVPSDIDRIGNGESHTQIHTHGIQTGSDTSLTRRSRVTSDPSSLNTIACGSPSSHRNGINLRSPAFLRPLETSPIPNRLKTEATGPGSHSEEEAQSNSIEDSGESTPRAATPSFEPYFQHQNSKNPSTTATSVSFLNPQNGEAERVNDLTNPSEGRFSSEKQAGGMPKTNSSALEKTPEPAFPLHSSRDSSHTFLISSSTGSSERSSTTPEPRAPATSSNGSMLQPALLQNSAATHGSTDADASGRLPITPSHYQNMNGTTNIHSGSPGLVLSSESSGSFYTAQEGSRESTPEGGDGKALHGQTDSEPLQDHVGKKCALGSSFSDLEQPSATSEKFNVMISL